MSNFSDISWLEQVRFWWDDGDDDVRFVPANMLSGIFSASWLKQRSVNSDTLLWFQANQSLL